MRANLSQISDSAGEKAFEIDFGNQVVTHLMGATEGSGVMLLMHMINDFGSKFDYLYGGTYARFFTFFLPAGLSAGRSPDFTTLAAQLYQPGQETSLGSTAMGEAYGNFGVAGILVLPLLTWFAVACSKLIAGVRGRHSLTGAVSFVMFASFVRFPFAENAITWIAALLVIRALRLEDGLPLDLDDDPNSVAPVSRLPADA